MLNDAVGFSAVYIMTGYTDLRSGIDRLAALVESKTDVNPWPAEYSVLILWKKNRPNQRSCMGEGWLAAAL